MQREAEGKEVEVDAMRFKNTGGTVRPERFAFEVEVRSEEVGRFLEMWREVFCDLGLC